MLSAISNFFGAIKSLGDKMKTPDERKIAKLEYRVEAAMKYVACNEKTGRYKKMREDKRQDHLLHNRKRIFDV